MGASDRRAIDTALVQLRTASGGVFPSNLVTFSGPAFATRQLGQSLSFGKFFCPWIQSLAEMCQNSLKAGALL
jgi:hypothetical protein